MGRHDYTKLTAYRAFGFLGQRHSDSIQIETTQEMATPVNAITT